MGTNYQESLRRRELCEVGGRRQEKAEASYREGTSAFPEVLLVECDHLSASSFSMDVLSLVSSVGIMQLLLYPA